MAHSQVATWRHFLPAHRLPVIAKTPVLVALGVYLGGGRFDRLAVGGALGLSAALWAALYALNESTDLIHEQGYTVRQSVRRTLFALPLALCLLAALLSPLLSLLFLLMAAGQFAYCVPPLRLKRYWWAILLLSGTINPILRLLCGVLWGAHAVPPLAYAVVVSLHLGASLRARVLLRERDARLGYRVAPAGSELVGIICTGVGLLGGFWLCVTGVLPKIFALFGVLAAGFAIYAWSGRETSVAHLRQGWLLFAIFSVVALLALLLRG
ncbi:MAG TPA: hypothetical protein VFB38_21315 [Chthonomonadaceae bacterium]|nr:hypothetical protein [Chthonomonadaceae bacterium]